MLTANSWWAQSPFSGLPPGMERDNVQSNLSAPGCSPLLPFLTPWTSCHKSWIDSCNFFLAHFRMQLELGPWLKASLPSSLNTSRTYPARRSHTVHPCHSQNAPIGGSMAQEQAGTAQALFSLFPARTHCCWTLRLALSEHAHLHQACVYFRSQAVL